MSCHKATAAHRKFERVSMARMTTQKTACNRSPIRIRYARCIECSLGHLEIRLGLKLAQFIAVEAITLDFESIQAHARIFKRLRIRLHNDTRIATHEHQLAKTLPFASVVVMDTNRRLWLALAMRKIDPMHTPSLAENPDPD